MTFSVKYLPLFKVDLLHRFFLDKGNTLFVSMGQADQDKQLDLYNSRSFTGIYPTRETAQLLNGHQLVFKPGATGFTIWTRLAADDDGTPFIPLADDLSLTFLIQLNDPRFRNYTNLDLDQAGNLMYFSNRRLPTEAGTFPLIGKSGDHLIADHSFDLSPAGKKAELLKLVSREKENLLGLIRIFMKADAGSLNMTDAQGKLQGVKPAFELLFENRKTFWRYIFNQDQTVKPGDDVVKENGGNRILITKTEQPLTLTGFISIEQDGKELPNPDVRLIKPDTSANKIYSEIYM